MTQEICQPNLLQSPQRLLSLNSNIAPEGFLKETLSSQNNPQESISTSTRGNAFMNMMELPVNNFLKSCKEIESEFYYVLSSLKSAIIEIPDAYDSYDRMVKKNQSVLPLHNLDIALSGNMEENY